MKRLFRAWRWMPGILAVLLVFSATAFAADLDPLPNTVDAGDLWHAVRHKPPPPPPQPADPADPADDDAPRLRPFFTIAPTVSSKPSTGLAAGISSNVAFVDGDPALTHFSTASAGFRYSTKEQALAGARFGVFTEGDRWFLLGDTRIWQTSLGTYALGDSAGAPGAAALRYNFYRVYETTYRQVGHHLFVGAGLNVSDHSGIRADDDSAMQALGGSAFTAYSAAHGFAADRQVSSGTNVGVLYDTRDNPINARHGAFASATYRTFYNGFLGGQSTWQELYLDARTYRPIGRGGRQTIAFWFLGDMVTGGTAPFLDLPYTSSDGRSARGYAEGQFRGPELLYGEVEYRATLVPNGLVGAVAFFNTTTVDGSGQRLFASYAPAAGGGLRFLLNKRSRTNLCVDYGVGTNGSRGLYLGIQEAF